MSTQSSNVLTSGGLLLGKLVRADSSASWSVNAMVSSPGTADYKVYVQNALPNAVTDLVLFDRLPATGDGRDSEFGVTLAGPVQGVPAGATVEYSTNATTATNGTWTTNPAGATAYRLNIPSYAPAQTFTLTFTVNVPSDLTGESAVNNVTATGMYGGSSRNFTSPSAQIQTRSAAGGDSAVINPGETATLNPEVTPGTGAIESVVFDNGETTKVVPGEGTWTIEVDDEGNVTATFTPEDGTCSVR